MSLTNYNTMKTVDLKKELDKIGVEYPKTKTGAFDRKTAADVLRSQESKSDQEQRLMSERMVIVLHNATEELGGSTAQFLSVNDVDWNIPRETEVDLPAYAVDVLDKATIKELYQVKEGEEYVTKIREKKRFNYSIIETYMRGEEEEEAEGE